jgi:hypothetical protein
MDIPQAVGRFVKELRVKIVFQWRLHATIELRVKIVFQWRLHATISSLRVSEIGNSRPGNVSLQIPSHWCMQRAI